MSLGSSQRTGTSLRLAGLVMACVLAAAACGSTASLEDQQLATGAVDEFGVPAGDGTAGAGAAADASGVAGTTTDSGAGGTPGAGPAPEAAASGGGGATGPLPAFPESGVTSNEIVFGSIYPVSSGFSQVFDAKELARLMERLVRRKNEAGGINGRKLRFVWYDDGFDPAKGAEVMKKLVEEDKVLAVVSTVTTFTTQNTANYLRSKNVTHIAPEGYQQESYTLDNFYPVTNYFDVQGERIGRYLSCDLGYKRVGVFSIGNYTPSKEGGDAIVRAVEKCGGTVVDRENPNFAETNYTPFVLRMRGANPDVVASAMDPLDDAVMLQTSQSQNFRPPKGMMFVSAFSAFKSIAKGAGAYANGFYSVSEFDSSRGAGNPRLQDFLAFAKSVGVDGTDRFALEVWAGFEIFVDAATRAGAELNRDTLRKQLDQTNIDLGFACEPFTFKPGPHAANPCLRVIQWDAGKGQWNTVVPFERVR